MRDKSLSYLTQLIAAPSPSGAEGPVAAIYRDYVRPLVDAVETDVNGNATAIINRDATCRIMLSGHMDEIGFIVHFIDENGMLYFSPVGGHDSPVPIGQMVWVHGRDRIAGAVGRKAIHLQSPSEKEKKPVLGELWIDIGASSRKEAEEVVSKGDYITYQHEFRHLLGDRCTGRGLDNKVGLFIASEALRLVVEDGGLRPGVGLFVLGTSQEEIGSRGAEAAAARIAPTTALAIDMEQAADYPGILKSQHGDLALGKGPTLSRGPNTNPVVLNRLLEAARSAGIEVQVQVSGTATPTDEKVIQTSGGGVASGLVGVALRYMHTPCEVASLSDIEACARLVAEYCLRLEADTDFTPF